MSNHSHHHSSPKNMLWIAFWLNTAFVIVEVLGSWYTHSNAILSDAIHDFGDTLAIGLGIVFERIALKTPDEKYTYGYKRYSLLSALVLGCLLLSGAVVMVFEAIESFIEPHPVKSQGMFGLAILGIVVNGIAFWVLHRSGHKSQNNRAIMLHFTEDVLGWVAVLLGSLVIYFTQWFWVDGLLSIGIACYISWNAGSNTVATMKVFLQRVPSKIDVMQLEAKLMELSGVIAVHDLKVWALDESEIIGTVKVGINQQANAQQVKKQVEELLRLGGIHQTVVEVTQVV